jgi:catechol-2,3-dioxygenase
MTYKVLVTDPEGNGITAIAQKREEVDSLVEKIVEKLIELGSVSFLFEVKVTNGTAEETYMTTA